MVQCNYCKLNLVKATQTSGLHFHAWLAFSSNVKNYVNTFSPPRHANSFSCEMLEGFLACPVCFKSSHNISVGLSSELWVGQSRTLHFIVYSQSLMDLLVCFGSLSCCRLQFCFSFNVFTGGLTCSSITLQCKVEFMMDSMMVSWSGPAAAKHHQTMTLPPHASLGAWGSSPGMLYLVYTKDVLCSGV